MLQSTQVTLAPLLVSVPPFSMNFEEICDDTQMGRKHALLGNYDSSIVYYQGVIHKLEEHCQTVRDPALNIKLQQVSFQKQLSIKPALHR